MKLYRYYSLLRPIGIGTYPKGGVQRIHNFDFRQHVPAIGREAWGYIEYVRELSEKEIKDYELAYCGAYEI